MSVFLRKLRIPWLGGVKRMHDSAAADRRLNARIAGLTLHARGDSRKIAAKARKGFEEMFERTALESDPSLSGRALEEKVQLLKRLHFTRLAKRSAQTRARRARRGRTND